MRVLILTTHARLVGGIQVYLDRLIPHLVQAGHEPALVSNFNTPTDRQAIRLPEPFPHWSLDETDFQRLMAQVRDWQPQVIFSHGMHSPREDAAFLDLAPGVYFAHAYGGLCISGLRAWKHPVHRPCERPFDGGCLAHFFPHGCGGRNPARMLAAYVTEQQRLKLFRRYARVLANSRHVADALQRQGLEEGRIEVPPMLALNAPPSPATLREWSGEGPVRLICLGRWEPQKGGGHLIEALPLLRGSLKRPVHLVMLGEGPALPDWRRAAAAHSRSDQDLTVEWHEWVGAEARNQLFDQAQVLVMPSLWPEPFGLGGIEAAARGLPACAYASGGIPEWLKDGVNGHLAPADPPRPGGLADALFRTFQDPDHYQALSRGAIQQAARFVPENHVPAVLRALDQAANPSAAQ